MTTAPAHKIPARSWGMVALVSLALLMFILDRQVLALLKTTLKKEMGWTDMDYSWLSTWFGLINSAGMLVMGRVIDRVGTRVSATLSIAVMSIATIGCGLAWDLHSMLVARMVQGFASAGVTLVAVVAITQWFPAERRATAISIKTPVGMMGYVLVPPVVALLTLHLNWRFAFFIPGVVGLLLPLAWWWLDRNAPDYGVKPAAGGKGRWTDILRCRPMWGMFLAGTIAGPVWAFYNNWQPGYLQEGLGWNLAEVGKYAWIPPVACSTFALVGGLASDRLVARGVPSAHSRVYVMQAFALFGATLWLLPYSKNLAVVLGAFACVHILYAQWNNLGGALMADTVPRGLLGGAFGVMGFVGGIIGSGVNLGIGWLIQTAGYNVVFGVLGALYPLGAVILWWFYIRVPAGQQTGPGGLSAPKMAGIVPETPVENPSANRGCPPRS